MTAAARTSETSVNFYQTTRRYNPEDSYFHLSSKVVTDSSVVLQRGNLLPLQDRR
jgi:hypothetical protein